MKQLTLVVILMMVVSASVQSAEHTIAISDEIFLSQPLGDLQQVPLLFAEMAGADIESFNLPDNAPFNESLVLLLNAMANRTQGSVECVIEEEQGQVDGFRVNYPNFEEGTFFELRADEGTCYVLIDNAKGEIERLPAKDLKMALAATVKLLLTHLKTDKYGMVGLPAGSFRDESGYRFSLESFAIGQHEISRGLWKKVRAWAQENGYSQFSAHVLDDAIDELIKISEPRENAIMTGMTWFEAVRWCNAYSEMNGLVPVYMVEGVVYRVGDADNVEINKDANGFRLPTEVQWEYACRAGTTTKFFMGDHPYKNIEDSNKYVRWIGNSEEGVPQVASRKPNPFGLYDMHGGAWEWCFDSDVGPYKVTRGSSFLHWFGEAASSASHYPHVADSREVYMGFRLARATGKTG